VKDYLEFLTLFHRTWWWVRLARLAYETAESDARSSGAWALAQAAYDEYSCAREEMAVLFVTRKTLCKEAVRENRVPEWAASDALARDQVAAEMVRCDP